MDLSWGWGGGGGDIKVSVKTRGNKKMFDSVCQGVDQPLA